MIENDTFRGTSRLSPAIPQAAFPTSSLPPLRLHQVEVQMDSIPFEGGSLRSSRASSQQTSQRRLWQHYNPEAVMTNAKIAILAGSDSQFCAARKVHDLGNL